MKKKLKYADRLGVKAVLIVAPEETARGMVRLKDMASGEEVEIAAEKAVGEISARLDKMKSV